jgi:hypothetical protein
LSVCIFIDIPINSYAQNKTEIRYFLSPSFLATAIFALCWLNWRLNKKAKKNLLLPKDYIILWQNHWLLSSRQPKRKQLISI